MGGLCIFLHLWTHILFWLLAKSTFPCPMSVVDYKVQCQTNFIAVRFTHTYILQPLYFYTYFIFHGHCFYGSYLQTPLSSKILQRLMVFLLIVIMHWCEVFCVIFYRKDVILTVSLFFHKPSITYNNILKLWCEQKVFAMAFLQIELLKGYSLVQRITHSFFLANWFLIKMIYRMDKKNLTPESR